MREFCENVKKDTKYHNELVKTFNGIQESYITFHKNYNTLLCDTLKKHFMGEPFSDKIELDDSKNINERPYSFAETLSKIILSLYSKGPINGNISWMDLNANYNTILDIVQQTLKIHNEGSNLALAILIENRNSRNGSDHCCKISDNLSVIRIMNIIRDMMIFIDSDLEGKLPTFDYPNENTLDIQSFFSDDKLNPKERKLVLVAGSLHDIPNHYRELLANLPWTMVIDLDTASDFGGLLSSVNDMTRINKVLWNKVSSVSANRDYSSGITEWYTCGDFLNFTEHDSNLKNNKILSQCLSMCTQQLISSTDKSDQLRREINKLFKASFESLLGCPYPVTIIYLYENIQFANSFISNIDTEFGEQYSFIGIYYSKKDDVSDLASKIYAGYPDDDLGRFNYYCCDLNSFFFTLEKYKSNLKLITPNNVKKTLPAKEGPKEIEQNRMQTLSKYFDVLYNDCASCDPEHEQKNKERFYKGGQADWSVFASYDGIVPLFEKEREYYTNSIEKLLDHAEQKNKVIVYHSPGIGGTTFVRSLCFSLHNKWPVVCCKRGYSPEMASELIALYDELKRGIIVLADNMEMEDIESLSKKLWESQSRPFCILASYRITQGTKSHMLSTLSEKERDLVIQYYYNKSPRELDRDEKRSNLDKALPNNENKVPFLVALYFLDKNFKGVKDYVEKTIDSCQSPNEIKVLAYAALMNIYNPFFYLSNTFALDLAEPGIDPKKNYLKVKDYAQSVLMKEELNCIKSKHYLISEEILKQVAIKVYNMSPESNYRAYLHSFANDFINDYFEFLRHAGNHYYETDNDILKGLFVEKDSNDDSKFSKLITEIGLNENSEMVLNKIVTLSEDYVSCCNNPVDTCLLYNAIAHFCGHFGRFYRNDGNSRKNYVKSLEHAKKSIEYMRCGSGNDARIFHMCGEAYRKYIENQLFYLCKLNLEFKEYCKEAESLESYFETANEMYDHVIECGKFQHGYLSEFELYLNFIGSMYYEEGDKKKWVLSKDKEDLYLCDIESIIDSLESIELDEPAEKKFQELVLQFRSGFYCKEDSINYYNGIVESARSSNNQELLSTARFGLLYARLKKWNEKPGDSNSLRNIMSLLDDICSAVNISTDSHTSRRMLSAYKQWMFFARLSQKNIQEGIVKAEQWRMLCDKLKINDPRPYYHLYVLEYLKMRNGYSKDNTADDFRKKCAELAEKSSGVFGKLDVVRDCLIQGGERHEMGCLYPRIKNSDAPDTTMLDEVEGTLENIVSKKGFVNITTPIQWRSLRAKFSLNKKISLREDHCSHKVAFYGAFTYEHIVAYNNIVADISTGESLEKLYRSFIEDTAYRSNNNEIQNKHDTKHHNVPKLNMTDYFETLFYPIECVVSSDGNTYLNGTLAKGEAAGFNLETLYKLDGCPEDVKEIAKAIIDSNCYNGLTVMCRKKINGKYEVLIDRSFETYDELVNAMGNDTIPKEKTQSDILLPKSCQASTVDYSFLKGKDVMFKCETLAKSSNKIEGTFEFNNKIYKGHIKCASAKIGKELLKQGQVTAKIVSPGEISTLKSK